jgi:predicted RNA-binding protein with PUA-like domain
MGKPSYWVIKSEPSAYSWAQLEKDRRTAWTGIRSFEARNNLKAMKSGDLLLYYHSGEGKEIVGIARVVSEASADPTAEGEDWVAVGVEAVAPLNKPVGLATLKSTAAFKDLALVKKGRLSVAPVSPDQFKRILELGQTKEPPAAP